MNIWLSITIYKFDNYTDHIILIVLKYKELSSITAILIVDKVTELFFMADEFRIFFDKMTTKYLRNDVSFITIIISHGRESKFT